MAAGKDASGIRERMLSRRTLLQAGGGTALAAVALGDRFFARPYFTTAQAISTIAEDLSQQGADFSKGGEWVEVTFEPSVTKEQRDALTVILPHAYPVTWKSFTVGQDAPIEWSFTNERAVARLAGGNAAEVVLIHAPTGMTKEPVVIKNLKYFGVPRNTGFALMPNEVNAYRVGAKPFESKGTNGFMITYDITSKDVKTA